MRPRSRLTRSALRRRPLATVRGSSDCVAGRCSESPAAHSLLSSVGSCASPTKRGNNDMRKLLLTASLLALASAGALAQAPQGVVPTAAVPQRTEPGRYWVFFAWNRADLPPDGRKVVEEAAQSFLRTGSARISLVGSADRTGSPAYNEKLSARRADAVRAELVRLGVPADAIAIRAEGENAPIVATAAGVREPLNRYVAIDFPERETPPPASAASRAHRTAGAGTGEGRPLAVQHHALCLGGGAQGRRRRGQDRRRCRRQLQGHCGPSERRPDARGRAAQGPLRPALRHHLRRSRGQCRQGRRTG